MTQNKNNSNEAINTLIPNSNPTNNTAKAVPRNMLANDSSPKNAIKTLIYFIPFTSCYEYNETTYHRSR